MFPIAQGSYICNLGQFWQNVTKLSIKDVKKMMNLKGVSRGQFEVCGFIRKCIRHSIASLALENGQNEQEELKKTKARF